MIRFSSGHVREICQAARGVKEREGWMQGQGEMGGPGVRAGATAGWNTHLWCSGAAGEAAEAAEEEGEGTFDSGTPAGTVH